MARRRTCRKQKRQRGGAEPLELNFPASENVGFNMAKTSNQGPSSIPELRQNQYTINTVGTAQAPGTRQTAMAQQIASPVFGVQTQFNLPKATFNKNRKANTVKVTSGGLLRSANTTRRLPTNRPSMIRSRNASRDLVK